MFNKGDVMTIDELAAQCGYFTSKHDVNNGYGCAHPKNEERHNGHGTCYSFSCPIAYELSPDDPDDLRIAGFTDPGDMSEGLWMQVHGKPRKVHVEDSAQRAVETRKRRKAEKEATR